MQTTVPLLAGIDYTALGWAAFWALVFSLSTLPSRRRWQFKHGEAPTPWWVVMLESLLGGVIGGVAFALALPERWPELRRPGTVALLAIGGAAIGPLLGRWIPHAVAQAVAFFSEKKLGVRIVVNDKEERHADAEDAGGGGPRGPQ